MTATTYAVFGLSEAPFAAQTASDAFFFPGEQYLRAFEFMGAALWTSRTLSVLVADTGCGKSMLVRRFLATLEPRVLCAEIHRTDLAAREFLDEILRQFGVELDAADRTDRRRLLHRFLTHQVNLGRVCLLVVENLQNMPPLVLDEVKLLSELEVEGTRAIKLLLLGQPLLNHVIDSPRMGAPHTTEISRYVLPALSEDQVAAYVAHRLRAAGAADPDQLMPYTLMPVIHAAAGGVPGVVNSICAQALATAAMRGTPVVTAEALAEAIETLGLAMVTAVPVDGDVAPADPSMPVAGPVDAVLKVATQGVADREIALRNTRVLIGRGELADVRIDSVFVSRYHALIVREPDFDLLIDLGSTNGVLVNSRRVLRHALMDRDLIQIGPARVTYQNPAASHARGTDPSQTVCFSRSGAANATGEIGDRGTVLAFGRQADTQG